MVIGDVKFNLFYTDMLLFLLLIVIGSYFLYARKHEHMIAPWRRLAKGAIAMGSLAILLCYLAVAVVDSIRFQINTSETQEPIYGPSTTLLDYWLQPLKDRHEKTYSAPFATHLYSKEAIEQPDGTIIRDFPRLDYGGIHLLKSGQSMSHDILSRSGLGLAYGLVVSAMILLLLALRLKIKYDSSYRQHVSDIIFNRSRANWRAFWLVLSLVIIISFIVGVLSTAYHVLGTDKIGESVLYQSIKSIRTGILIGTLTTLVMLPFAILMGISAGYFRGWVDDIIQFLYTTLNSIPGVLLIASVILMLQVYLDNNVDQNTPLAERADLRLLFLCMVLGITSWTGLCRYLRAESLKLREMDYIAAARSLGVSHATIITRHILPNVMHIVLITVVIDFSGLVLAEAVLAYVQVGVDPTTESWGNMINSARLEMARDPVVWWSLSAAFFFMLTLVLAANLLSDAVRDALDPRGEHDR